MLSSRLLTVLFAALFAAVLVSSSLVATSLGVDGPEAWRRGLLVLLILGAWWATRSRPNASGAPLITALLLIAWSCALAARAQDPGLATARIGDLLLFAAALFIGGRMLAEERRRFLLMALLATSLASLATLVSSPWPLIDAGGGVLATRNLSASLAALAIPFASLVALDRSSPERRLAALTAVASVAYVLLSGNRLAPIAGAVGVAAGLASGRRLSPKAWAATALALALVLFAFLPRATSPTVTERLALFDATAHEIKAAPLLGVGPGQWRVELPRAAEGTLELNARRQPAHAHSEPLEWTAELGPLGLVALAVLLLLGLAPLLRRAPPSLPAASSVATLLVICLAAFPLAQPELLVVFGLLLAEAHPGHPRRWHVRFAPLFPAAVLAVTAFTGLDLAARFQIRTARQLTTGQSPDFQTAAEHIERARAVAPWSFDAERLATWIHSVRGEPERAAEAAASAAIKRPHHPGALNDLALTQRELGHRAEAEALLRRAHALAPREPEIALNLAELIKDSPAHAAEAKALFESAIESNPNLTTAWSGLAQLAQAAGDLKEAVALTEAARGARLRNQIYLKKGPN